MFRKLVVILIGLLLFECQEKEEKKYATMKALKEAYGQFPEKRDSIIKVGLRLYEQDSITPGQKIWITSIILDTVTDHNQRIDLIQKTLHDVEKEKGELLISLPVLYNLISYDYSETGDTEKGIQYGFKGVEYALEVKKKYGLKRSNLEFSYFNLALAYRKAGDFFNYKKYMKKSLETSAYEDSKGYIYHNLGDYYLSKNDIDSAFYYTKLAKENYLEQNNISSVADLSYNLADLYFEKHQYKEAQQELGPEKIKLLKEYELLYAYHYILLSRIHTKLDDLPQAKAYLALSKNMTVTNEDKMDYFQAESEYFDAQADYQQSKQALDSFIVYHNKFKDEQLIDKSKELEKGFYLKQKDLSINKLLLKNQIADERNKRTTILIIAFSLLVLLLGFFYYLYNKNSKLKAENKRNLLEQKLFASQMSPHFIFNALSAIQAEIISNNSKEATQYLTKFGKLLQNILANTNQDLVTISSEYINLIHYIDLQKIRYKNFDYQLDVYQGIDEDEDEIPPMLIQPLVENAIEHGIKTISNGLIHIEIKKYDKILSCTVSDNGLGLNSKSKSNEISTTLIRKRLSYLELKHNTKLELTIKNNEKQGVTSMISIPYLTKF